MRWGFRDMEAKPRPILNTQPVFKSALKILTLQVPWNGYRPPVVHRGPCSAQHLLPRGPGKLGQVTESRQVWVETRFAGWGARLDWSWGYQRLWSLQYGGLPGCFRMDL